MHTGMYGMHVCMPAAVLFFIYVLAFKVQAACMAGCTPQLDWQRLWHLHPKQVDVNNTDRGTLLLPAVVAKFTY